ncbi:MAG TPA: hypothetical protein VMI72_04200, partial [Roseiarcus sp.]|nr:hypothetical protein [Roseiarcus sp.]
SATRQAHYIWIEGGKRKSVTQRGKIPRGALRFSASRRSPALAGAAQDGRGAFTARLADLNERLAGREFLLDRFSVADG